MQEKYKETNWEEGFSESKTSKKRFLEMICSNKTATCAAKQDMIQITHNK